MSGPLTLQVLQATVVLFHSRFPFLQLHLTENIKEEIPEKHIKF